MNSTYNASGLPVVGYVDFLVDSIVSILEDLTHDIWTEKQKGHKSIIQLANMTSFKLKSAQGLAIWRIQYHKNLITDKNVSRKRTGGGHWGVPNTAIP